MKATYLKPEIKLVHVIYDSWITLSAHQEAGNGIQAARGSLMEMEEEEEEDYLTWKQSKRAVPSEP